ncbi:hypothetical protein F0L68_38790 [Solihabitans fulvus]|uniref:Uncharacterized protein n=1 Tax=Solihabitans fulvus TaxID=1892852 RepID=A0A5B2WIG9_9PSEU|nr:hypothetical protein [Solihabitans fulvus]KAA2250708.1 hypothetical protein F0L68_38790 [Solihabitans fulvus]
MTTLTAREKANGDGGEVRVLVTIDLASDRSAAAGLRELDARQRDLLLRAVRDLVSSDNDSDIVDRVRTVLAEEFPPGEGTPTPVGVVFGSTEWDNGFFPSESGKVLFSDGSVSSSVDFGSVVEESLTEEFGCVGRRFTVTVDLRSGEVDPDSDGDGDLVGGIHNRFQVLGPKGGE